MKYFFLEDFNISDISHELLQHAKTIDRWAVYGFGRFKIHCLIPDRENILPLAKKFKNPRDILHKIEFNKVSANGIVLPHTDHNRWTTLNIPLEGDFKNSTVDFYEKIDEGVKSNDYKDEEGNSYENSARSFIKCPIEERVSYQVPICFDTQTVHGVTNNSDKDRYIITVSFKQEYTVETLFNMYKEGLLLNA